MTTQKIQDKGETDMCMREKGAPAGCFILFRVCGRVIFSFTSCFCTALNYDNRQWLILLILDLLHRNMVNQSFELKKTVTLLSAKEI